jgi:hypothetical protein
VLALDTRARGSHALRRRILALGRSSEEPQDIRFAIAIPPSAMIRMTAIGVSQAMMLL